MQTATKTMRISALLPSVLVAEVRKVSQREQATQSSIIKSALEHWFKKRLEKDAKELSKIIFSDLPTEDKWLSVQSKI